MDYFNPGESLIFIWNFLLTASDFFKNILVLKHEHEHMEYMGREVSSSTVIPSGEGL